MIGFNNGMYANGYPAYNNPYNPIYQERMAQIQNNYQQALPQAAQGPQQATNAGIINQGLLWVQGEAGAKAYLMAPNTTVLLMDSENERFYIKSTDGAGMPNLRVFEYNEVHGNQPTPQQQQPIIDTNQFVSREEFEGLKKQYDELIKKIDSKDEKSGPILQSSRIRKNGVNADE